MEAISFLFLFHVAVQVLLTAEAAESSNKPNIIFILADDLGYNDVSYHGSPQIPTPNIDALAASGIRLKNYYGQCLCTPSRAALMTGKYPIRTGLQHFIILSGERTALPLHFELMPQHLKRLGYSTHMIGKWHLGFFTKAHTPTYRGFDTFFGYYNGYIDYYKYLSFSTTHLKERPEFLGIDLQNGTTPVRDFSALYATEVFTEKAENIILTHDTSKPLFLYLAHLAVHTGLEFGSQDAPTNILEKFSYIRDKSRKMHAGRVSVLDASVGRIFKALYKKGILKNSIIVFASDNGGNSQKPGGSSNYPFRGQKLNLFEGGVHIPAIIWSPIFQLNEPRVSNDLMHVTDWLPTFYEAAGGNLQDLGTIDGHSMWKTFTSNSPSPRTELLHNIDPVFGMSALRINDFKVVNGTDEHHLIDWYGHTGFEYINPPQSMDEWVFKNGSTVKEILEKSSMWLPKEKDAWRRDSVIHCPQLPPDHYDTCDPKVQPCLFNIIEDPCERRNIARQYPEVVKDMMEVIHLYDSLSMKPLAKDECDPLADPLCHDFAFVPWLDPEFPPLC